jgi:hypothetical protein
MLSFLLHLKFYKFSANIYLYYKIKIITSIKILLALMLLIIDLLININKSIAILTNSLIKIIIVYATVFENTE